MKVEIEKIKRKKGIWKGNVLKGVVIKKGKKVKKEEIEVEYVNEG